MASRQSVVPPSGGSRPLSLTEELEKLEQSITLTLQEIDANFSRAHRIVTSSIIPTVERYRRHSDAVWQGSKFWKGFFEASANISLTGYEEPTEVGAEDADGSETTQATVGISTEAVDETFESEDATERPTSRLTDETGATGERVDGSSLMDSPSMSVKAAAHGTPKGMQRRNEQSAEEEGTSSFAVYPFPHEPVKKETEDQQIRAPTTPGLSATPGQRPSPFRPTTERRQPNPDPLLHRVLDKNYRVQATPRTARKKGPLRVNAAATAAQEVTSQPTRTLNPALDSSPFSPAIEAPRLRAEIFGTPGDKKRKDRSAPTPRGPRTPGISVQGHTSKSGFTPGHDHLGTARKTLFTAATDPHDVGAGRQEERDNVDWRLDSDSDEDSAPFGGMSPPKTIQFNLPQNKLLQTPAKEASKRIVEDLLSTAGADSVTDETSQPEIGAAPIPRVGGQNFDDSPSVVRVSQSGLVDDDTF